MDEKLEETTVQIKHVQLLCAGASQTAESHHVSLLVKEVLPKLTNLTNHEDLVLADTMSRYETRLELPHIIYDDLPSVTAHDKVAVYTLAGLHSILIRLQLRCGLLVRRLLAILF